MAYIGLANIHIAKWTQQGYTEGFKLGEGIGMSIEPQYKEGKLYGDNKIVDNRRKFKEAKVEIETSYVPTRGVSVLYGHEYDATNRSIVSKITDESNYVGIGATVTNIEAGTDKIDAVVVFKAKFQESKSDYKTEGDSIEYNTPQISGTAIGNENDEWREVRHFANETEAVKWIKETLNINDDVEEQQETESQSISEYINELNDAE